MNKKQKSMKLLLPIIVVVVIAIVISLVFVFNRKDTKAYDDKLEQAQKYVEEMDYKRAETAYLEAIKIDSKQPKAYLKLADVYVADEQADKAIKILNKGLKNVDKDDQKEIKDKLKKYKNEEKMYEEYAKITSKYLKAANDENIYENYDFSGYEDINTEYIIDCNNYGYEASFSLYDINKDNVPELLIGLSKEDYQDYHNIYDAYTFVDGKIYQLMAGVYRDTFYLCENGIIAETGSGGWQDFFDNFYILPENAKKLKIVDRIGCEEGSYYHSRDNKIQISEEEYLDILSQYTGIYVDYYKLTQENIDQCKKGNLGICKEI